MQVLFARHHVRVYRFVLRLVGNPTTAEDLISEVFLDVWRQADRFEGRSAVSTWMLAIARFKALSALRKRPDEELDELGRLSRRLGLQVRQGGLHLVSQVEQLVRDVVLEVQLGIQLFEVGLE